MTVEITPEMIEAGAIAISEHTLEETAEDGAVRVYLAMIAAVRLVMGLAPR